MLDFSKYLLFIFLSLLVISSSCKKEEIEPRTWEMEMAELDEKIKQLEAKGIDVDTTNLSVFYFVIEEGEGAFPQTNDSCHVSYIGFLPDGSKLEDSRDIHPPDGKWRFKFRPLHKVVGLVNAIGYMNKGAEIEMYVTSDHAYGPTGTSKVPPYTTLIYRAKMHDLFVNE